MNQQIVGKILEKFERLEKKIDDINKRLIKIEPKKIDLELEGSITRVLGTNKKGDLRFGKTKLMKQE